MENIHIATAETEHPTLTKNYNMKIELTNFAKRHFNKTFVGTKILDMTPQEFTETVSRKAIFSKSIEGYADFCKLVFIKNDFTDTKTGTMKLGLNNLQYLRSGYSSRRKEELETLSRWLEIPREFIPRAEYICVVLYSREQLLKEHETMPLEEFELSDKCEWGIVSIMGQMYNEEEPMTPQTFLRNYMPIEFGGSGMIYPVDKEDFNKDYKRSIDFWKNNASLK